MRAGFPQSSKSCHPPIVSLIRIKVSKVGCPDIGFMSAMIVFRCPRTGMRVQTLLSKQGSDEARFYEVVTCPACTQFHFINKATGKALGDNTE
jgi:hypothetical protein